MASNRRHAQRRNVLTRVDARIVLALAIVAGLTAPSSGCRPTGQSVPDAVICFALVAFVTWAGVAAAAASPAGWLALSALTAGFAAAWIGLDRANLGVARAAIGGVVVQVLLRLEWDPFFAASALLAGGVMALLVVTGLQRRPSDVRRRVSRGMAVLASVAGAALVGLLVGGLVARPAASDGYDRLTEGFDLLRSGDSLGAAVALREAAVLLEDADRHLSRPWAAPARAVPLLAQHQVNLSAVFADASAAATNAATALEYLDLDQLRVVDGVVDVEAIGPAMLGLDGPRR